MIRSDLGYTHVHSDYDESGNEITVKYFDTEENLTLHPERNYAITEYQYDAAGRLILEKYYGINEKPAINIKHQCAGFRYQYDEYGRQTDIWFIGSDGNLIVPGDRSYAYAHAHYEYDKFGNEIEASYYDTDEEPMTL